MTSSHLQPCLISGHDRNSLVAAAPCRTVGTGRPNSAPCTQAFSTRRDVRPHRYDAHERKASGRARSHVPPSPPRPLPGRRSPTAARPAAPGFRGLRRFLSRSTNRRLGSESDRPPRALSELSRHRPALQDSEESPEPGDPVLRSRPGFAARAAAATGGRRGAEGPAGCR